MSVFESRALTDISETFMTLTKAESINLAESIFEIIKSTLEPGENLLISGFGKFYVREKKTRRGRNL
jgi:nucleoid DNA-binding protein